MNEHEWNDAGQRFQEAQDSFYEVVRDRIELPDRIILPVGVTPDEKKRRARKLVLARIVALRAAEEYASLMVGEPAGLYTSTRELDLAEAVFFATADDQLRYCYSLWDSNLRSSLMKKLVIDRMPFSTAASQRTSTASSPVFEGERGADE